MMIRHLVFSGAIFYLSPAFATDLPREITCRFETKVTGAQNVDELTSSSVDGIARWDETQTPGEKDCGQSPWPPMKPSHCYGISESDRNAVISNGYCVEEDQDGDKIIWKMDPNKNDQFYSATRGTSQILMGGGKYSGITGTSKWQCTYGASALKYIALCHIEQMLKFPAKE
jgi:hypothetical protein